jgi:hypothetical protein
MEAAVSIEYKLTEWSMKLQLFGEGLADRPEPTWGRSGSDLIRPSVGRSTSRPDPTIPKIAPVGSMSNTAEGLGAEVEEPLFLPTPAFMASAEEE